MTYLDWETLYTPTLSLAKMPTMEYVRKTQPLAVGITQGTDPVQVQYAPDFDLPSSPCVAHNASFDAAVSAQFANHRPVLWFDTMLMARYAISQGHLPSNQHTALKAFGTKGNVQDSQAQGTKEQKAYIIQDVEICRSLFQKLLPLVPAKELALINLHVQMAAYPRLVLNERILQDAAAPLDDTLARLRKNDNFAEALRIYGVEPEVKQGKLGEGYAFAKSDPFMRSLHRHQDPKIRALVRLREEAQSSITRTRAQRFLDVGSPLPCPLLYYGAHTGRASGQDKLNLQNLTRGGVLRQSLMAPEGHSLVICDSGQIEARVLAWLAGQKDVLEAFATGRDVYKEFATRLYKCRYDEVTGDQRRVAKAAVLALGYGQGANGFLAYCEQYGVPMDQATAKRVVTIYRAVHQDIVAYWQRVYTDVLSDGEWVLPTGRKLTYPDMENQGDTIWYTRPYIFSKGKKGERQRVKLWHGLVAENITQAVARDVVVLEQTLELARTWPVVISVHDEVVLCVRDDEAADAKAHAEQVFQTPPEWAPGLPVVGKAVIAKDYGEKP